MSTEDRQPGDAIIDRYAPYLEGAAREEARERLIAYVRLMVRLALREVREDMEREDSEKSQP